MPDIIFLRQTINSSIKGQKRQKIVKFFGKVTPCNLLKIAYISRGATVFSLISIHWSDNNYGKDADKSYVALWSFIINETFKKIFSKISQKVFLTEHFKGQENCLDLSGPPCNVYYTLDGFFGWICMQLRFGRSTAALADACRFSALRSSVGGGSAEKFFRSLIEPLSVHEIFYVVEPAVSRNSVPPLCRRPLSLTLY